MTDDRPDRPRPQQVHDPRILRAIAHPVRARILDELGATGPMRAADIAQALHIPANQASFHLRQLAKYGLAVEAPEEARDGRDRVWKAAHDAGLDINTRELAEAPGGKAAVQVFRRVWTGSAHDAVDRAENADTGPETRTMVSDAALRLTRDEVDQFADELHELTNSWRRRGRKAGPEARTYQLLQILQPARELDPPR